MHPDASKLLFDDEVGRWPPDLAASRGWVLHNTTFPVIDCEFTRAGRTPIRVRLVCTDWDDQPPSVELLNSAGQFLQSLTPNPTGVFNGSAHAVTGRPFVCMAGSREYHTHTSHLNDPWSQHRDKPGFSLGDILTKLWHAWLKGSG